MTFVMKYDKRNRENLNKLADNTKILAYKWYEYCINNKINVLIYETIRTVEQQKKNVAKGASKTMKSYHIVGQALDFVFVDSKGNALWSINDYVKKEHFKAITYAKSLGFTWGGDWNNNGDWRDETFLDSPHLQYNYKGYGTDTFNKTPLAPVKDFSKQIGYKLAKDSNAFRLHSTAFKSHSQANDFGNMLIRKGYIKYFEVISNGTTEHRIQSGKYLTLKIAETVAMAILKDGLLSYVSVIGTLS